MTLKAYAKINLGLRVLGKRPDGYHDIETVMHRVNVFDKISLEPSDTISLQCIPADFPSDDRNLCVKAATALQEYCRVRTGVRITLRKTIPVGAGLGGGSSDAAATLLGLVRLWRLSISDTELREMAFFLGADVPYFLKDGTAHATGRGEQLEYFALDLPYWIVLVYPGIAVYTAWAYAKVGDSDGRGDRRSLKSVVQDSIHNPAILCDQLQNDFEPIVLSAHPEVGEVKARLLQSGALVAQMSGSGSSVYGFFADQDNAETISTQLRTQHQVFLTPPHFRPRARG